MTYAYADEKVLFDEVVPTHTLLNRSLPSWFRIILYLGKTGAEGQQIVQERGYPGLLNGNSLTIHGLQTEKMRLGK